MTTPARPMPDLSDPRKAAAWWHAVLVRAAPKSATDPVAARVAEGARQNLRAAVRALDVQTRSLNAEERKKALDPGWLAALGLGVSQAGTFGFGDEAAGLLEGVGAALVPGGRGFSEAYSDATSAERATRAASRESQPTAYWTGEVLGTLPALAGTVVTKAPAVAGTLSRAAARAGLAGLKGGLLVGTETAGRTDDATLAERLTAGAEAAPYGFVAGAGAAVAPSVVGTLGRRLVWNPLKRVWEVGAEAVERTAGKQPRLPLPKLPFDLLPAAGGVLPELSDDDRLTLVRTLLARQKP